MGFKHLQTRIALKYDSYTNWQNSTIELLPGELAVAYLGDTKTPDAYNTGTDAQKATHPVLFKVGPGKFNDLPWASALAADVYGWAKASDVELVESTDAEGKVTGRKLSFKGTNKTVDINFVTEAEVLAITNQISAAASKNAEDIEAEATARSEAIEALETKYDAAIEDINEAIEGANTAAGDAAQAVTDLAAGAVTDNANAIRENASNISNEVERATEAEGALSDRLDTLEVFFNSADADGEDTEGGKTLYDALDTLKEIQDYIINDGSAASDMLDAIDANAEAIVAIQDIVKDGGTLEARVDQVESSLATAQDNIDDLNDAVEILNAATAGYNASNTISSAISGVAELAQKGVDDAADALGAAQAAQDDIDDLAEVIGDASSGLVEQVNTNASNIAAIADDYVSFRKPSETAVNAAGEPKFNLFAGEDIIIFNCGTADDVI